VKQHLGKEGIHFFDRKTGLNILFDEITVPAERINLAPKYVSIALTNLCNLKCGHCYAPKSTDSLDFEQLKKWLRILDDNGTLGVGFGGGEPFLYKKLPDLCNYIASETSLALSLTTHGHQLTEQVVQSLKNKVNFYRLSMDGVGMIYEKIRGRSFNQFLDKVKIVSRHSKFGINYVVNDKTISSLDEAVQIAEELGAFEFLLLPQVATEKVNGIDQDHLSQLRNWVHQSRYKIRLAISASLSDGFPICGFGEQDQSLLRYLHIDAKGILKNSSFTNEGFSVGDDLLGIIKKMNFCQELV
jgi:MoaA/NifB/PqqE/SkfB family radical SAM enzyme